MNILQFSRDTCPRKVTVARPVTKDEVNLLLEQPIKEVLQLSEQLEPIEPSVICEGA